MKTWTVLKVHRRKHKWAPRYAEPIGEVEAETKGDAIQKALAEYGGNSHHQLTINSIDVELKAG